jgi:hypothetical protein
MDPRNPELSGNLHLSSRRSMRADHLVIEQPHYATLARRTIVKLHRFFDDGCEFPPKERAYASGKRHG